MNAQDSWAVITDEEPSLQTLWNYSSRFCVEELFLDSKSGAFELAARNREVSSLILRDKTEDSRLRHTDALKRLYLIAAVALLYATTTGMTVQISGLRTTVDPHWRRGLSYLCLVQRTLRRPSSDTSVPTAGLRQRLQRVGQSPAKGVCIRKIGLRYLRGVINKGRVLLVPIPLFYKDPEPCFASKKAQLDFYDSIWFERIVTITCKT